jgi:hypothetical protein
MQKWLILILCLDFLPVMAQKTDFTIQDRERLVKIETRQEEFEKRVIQQFTASEKSADDRAKATDERLRLIENQMNFLGNLMIGLICSIFGLIGGLVGFIIWDRRATNQGIEKRLHYVENLLENYSLQNQEFSQVKKQTPVV